MKCFQLSFFLAAAVLVISSSRLFSADDALKDSEKKLYKTDATYTEIAEDPEKFIKKEPKRCMKAIYNGYITKLPPPFEKMLQKSTCLLKIYAVISKISDMPESSAFCITAAPYWKILKMSLRRPAAFSVKKYFLPETEKLTVNLKNTKSAFS